MVQTEAQYQFIYMAISQYIDTFKSRMMAGAKSLRDYTNIRYAVQEPNAASLINSISSSSATSSSASSAPPAFGSNSQPSAPLPPLPISRDVSGPGIGTGKPALPPMNIPMDVDNGFSCNNHSATYQNL